MTILTYELCILTNGTCGPLITPTTIKYKFNATTYTFDPITIVVIPLIYIDVPM